MGRGRVRFGEIGEDLAVQELERLGYAVLDRRFRRPSGEIDIVATDGPTVVFVEVKARDGCTFGDAPEAVTTGKQHRLAATARAYLARRGWLDRPCRFDVVAVRVVDESPQIELFRNAFSVTG